MIGTAKKAEFVEFEIVRESEEAPRTSPPWATLRWVPRGLAGAGLLIVLLAFGVLLMVPLLIMALIARLTSKLFRVGAGR